MADLVLADFVKEATTTTGTGTYSLSGSVTGHQGFVAAGLAGKKIPYVVADGTNWEFGLGTVTDAATDTISRDKIYGSSNSGSAVDWAAGTRDIFLAEISNRPNAVHTITGNTTLGYSHNLVLCNSASAFTVTFPPAAEYQGKEYTITNVNTGIVTIDGNSTETIVDPTFGSAQTLLLWVQYDSARLVSDGLRWYVVTKNFTPHKCEIRRNTAQALTGGYSRINFEEIAYEIGVEVDLANNDEIKIKRPGKYKVFAQGGCILSDGQFFTIRIHDSVAAFDWAINRVFASAAGEPYANPVFIREFAEDDIFGMDMNITSGTSNTFTNLVNQPILSVVEVF